MSLKVLIVDDDDIVIFLHDLVIKESGLSDAPLTFMTAVSALEWLNKEGEQYDRILIFLDINMYGMDGWDLLEEIEKAPYTDRVSVVMVTSSIDREDREKAGTYPQVIRFVEKPLSIEACTEIRESLRELFG